MKKRLSEKLKKVISRVSIAVTLLLPVFLGSVLCRILIMGGHPLWWLLIHILLLIVSLGQALYLLTSGVLPAMRAKKL